VRSICLPGKRVLDLFCYTGGFAINAAQGERRRRRRRRRRSLVLLWWWWWWWVW